MPSTCWLVLLTNCIHIECTLVGPSLLLHPFSHVSDMDICDQIKKLVVAHHGDGLSIRRIAELTKVPKTSVHRIINDHRQTGSIINNRGKCGRKQILDVRTARLLARVSASNPSMAARQIQAEVGGLALHVSHSTIKRSLRRSGMISMRPRKAPMLTVANKLRRRQWCRDHANLTMESWRRIIFTDETAIAINDARPLYVRKRQNEVVSDRHTITHRPFVKRVMTWSCVSYYGIGELVPIDGTMTAQKYIHTLESHLIPQMNHWFPSGMCYMQHDNAPCHKARAVTDFLADQEVNVINWPPYSPDLNCIENLWAILKRKMCISRQSTRAEVIAQAQQVWNEDPSIADAARKVIDSMPRRVAACLKANGGYIGY